MKFTRMEFRSSDGQVRSVPLDHRVAIVDESPSDAERILAAIRDLYLGIKRHVRMFASVDDVEFELNDEIVPLIGQRLGGTFTVLDLVVAPIIATDPTDVRDVQAVVARAALETVGVGPATLDLERLDQASLAVDRYRDPLANDAHAAYLRRTGLLQLFSRRSGRDLLDPADPAVAQLARFDEVLTDRRRQVSTSSAPLPDEVDRATEVLRELVSARVGGIPPERAATMSREAIEGDVSNWVAQQHDRAVTPLLTERLQRHAAGIDVVGSIPVVLDLRRVDRFPPGGDAIRHAAEQHSDELQFIVLSGSTEGRRWIEDSLAPGVC